MNREFSEPQALIQTPTPKSPLQAGRQAGRQRGSEWRTQASGPRPAENSRLYSQWTAQLTTNPGLQLGQSLNLNRPIEPLNRHFSPRLSCLGIGFRHLRQNSYASTAGSGPGLELIEPSLAQPGKDEKSKNKPVKSDASQTPRAAEFRPLHRVMLPSCGG